MKNNNIKNEIKAGNTLRVRTAVRNALFLKFRSMAKGGFEAKADIEHLDFLHFTENAIRAGVLGTLDDRAHLFEVAIPYADVA